MRKSLKSVCFLGLLICVFFLSSCKGFAKINLADDGAVEFAFSGSIGNSFKDLIGENNIADERKIAADLRESGFSNVKVSCVDDKIALSFRDDNQSSYLFTSGLVSVVNGKIKVSLTPERFKNFYEASGEDIRNVIDVFMSPVLNDEVMSEEEYIDFINVSYGEEIGSELAESSVDFGISDKTGKNRKVSVLVSKILCGINVSF